MGLTGSQKGGPGGDATHRTFTFALGRPLTDADVNVRVRTLPAVLPRSALQLKVHEKVPDVRAVWALSEQLVADVRQSLCDVTVISEKCVVTHREAVSFDCSVTDQEGTPRRGARGLHHHRVMPCRHFNSTESSIRSRGTLFNN